MLAALDRDDALDVHQVFATIEQHLQDHEVLGGQDADRIPEQRNGDRPFGGGLVERDRREEEVDRNVSPVDPSVAPLRGAREHPRRIEIHPATAEGLDRARGAIRGDEQIDVEIPRAARIAPETVGDRTADRIRDGRRVEETGDRHRDYGRIR